MSKIDDFFRLTDEALAAMAGDAKGRELLERSYRQLLSHLGEMPRRERKLADRIAIRIQKALRSGSVLA